MALQTARDYIKTSESRVDPESLETLLIPSIHEQCRDDSYDLEVNLVILKHYNLRPIKTNIKVVRLILAKALMQLPARDFSLELYLIPMLGTLPALASLVEAEHLMRSCRFLEFWAIIEADQELIFLRDLKNFTHTIRKYILKVIGMSHRSLRESVLGGLLNVKNPKELQEFLGGSWEIENGIYKNKCLRITLEDNHMADTALKSCIAGVS